MKTKSFLFGVIALFSVICGLSYGQTAPTAYAPPAVQKLSVSHATPDGYTATLALVQSPRFDYNPITGTATATISVAFFKDADAFTTHKRPADYSFLRLTAAQTASALSPSAITQSGGTPLAAATAYLLTLPDYAGATKISK
jgi:hypothetical protein